jgi:hypothetical protein
MCAALRTARREARVELGRRDEQQHESLEARQAETIAQQLEGRRDV